MDEKKEETEKTLEAILKPIKESVGKIAQIVDETRATVRDLYARPEPANKSRPTLYVMVWVTMMGVLCGGPCTSVASTVGSYYGTTAKEGLELHVENVLGGEEPEKFYLLNGQRAYIEVDGVPVEESY